MTKFDLTRLDIVRIINRLLISNSNHVFAPRAKMFLTSYLISPLPLNQNRACILPLPMISLENIP